MSYLINKLRKSKIASATLAAILAFSVLLSTFSGLAIFAEQDLNSALDIWELAGNNPEKPYAGAVSEPTTGGDGSSAEKAILITTPEELAYVISNGGAGKYYKLTADIYLNDPDAIDWRTGAVTKAGYTFREWCGGTFTGTIDGDGHTVYGIFLPHGTGSYYEAGGAGFITKVADGGSLTIKNLGIDKSYAHTVGYTSAFVGTASAGASVSFENCFVGENVLIKGHSATAFLATGKTGNPSVSITNCYNQGALEAMGTSNAYEGLVGDFWTGSVVIKNSYNTDGYVYNKSNCSGSENNYGTAAGHANAATTVVTLDNMKGADVLTAAAKMPNLGDAWTEMGDGKYPVQWIFSGKVKPDYWDGTTAQPTKGGDGSADDKAILISTPEELAYVLSGNSGGKYYKLTNDIYLNNPDAVEWTTGSQKSTNYQMWPSDKSFNGTLDGCGYTIYGVYMPYTPTSGYYEAGGEGLISKVNAGESAIIKNLGIDKSYYHTAGYMSAFVGVMPSGGTLVFENCYVGAEVTVKGHSATAFLATGKLDAPSVSIDNCYSLANLEAKGTSNAYEGLVGDLWTGSVVIKNSYNTDGYVYNKSNCAGSANNYGTAAGHANADTAVVSLENMKGADVLENAAKMPKLGDEWTEMGEGKYPVQWIFSGKVKPVIWDGTKVAPTKGGDGSAADKAILIETPSELAHVVYTGGAGKYYKLAADMYLNNLSKINWATGETIDGYTPNNWYDVASKAENPFTGHIDGDGHTVYGMFSSTYPSNYYWSQGGSGFISKATSGAVSIKNMGIDKAYVNDISYAAAFIGGTSNNTSDVLIDSCYVGKDVTLAGFGAGAFVGAAINATNTVISNCYSLATLQAKGTGGGAYVGFMVEFYGSGNRVVKNSYNANGPISGGQSLTKAECANNYETVAGNANANATVISADKMKGADVLTAADQMPNLGSAWMAVGAGAYPVPKAFAASVTPDTPDTPDAPDDPDEPEITIWDGTKVAPTKGGNGSSTDTAILIENAKELAHVVYTGGQGKYYKLAADIYLNNVDKVNWTTGVSTDAGYTVKNWFDVSASDATATFSGFIDGDGHTIYGMLLSNSPASYANNTAGNGYGLITKATSGEVGISNLGIDKAYIDVNIFGAAFIGSTANNTSATVINACYVGENVTVVGHGAAAFVANAKGTSSTTISNCYSLANLVSKGTRNAHTGLLGEFSGNGATFVVTNSYNANGYITKGRNLSSGSGNNYETVAGNASANATLLSTDNMKGADVLTSDSKMKNLGDAWTEMGDGKYPVPWAFSGKTPAAPPSPETFEGWNGTTVTAPTKGGNGSSEDTAIIIETAAELAYVVKNGGQGKYYKLANDIALNDVTKIDFATGTSTDPLYIVNNWFTRNDSESFYGTIDGCGHTITGVVTSEYLGSYFEHGSVGIGFIARTTKNQPTVIKNLGIDKSYIHGSCNAGAFVGYASGANSTVTITDCYTGADVYVSGHNAAAFVGAVTADNPKVTVNNCYNLGTLTNKSTTSSYVGFVGDSWGGQVEINNGYNATGPIYMKNNGGLRANNYETVAGSKTSGGTVVSVDNMKGADVLTNGTKMPGLGEGWTEMGDGNFPVQWIFSGKTKPVPEYFAGWDGKTFTAPTKGGDGSAEDKAILIETAAELAYVIKNGGEGKYYKLANDIALNDVTKIDWTTGTRTVSNYVINNWLYRGDVESFYGTIDGAGHTITGMVAVETGSFAQSHGIGGGLIPIAHSGKPITIKNLGIDYSYVRSTANAGAFIGTARGGNPTITFSGCYVGENVTVEGYNAAAFIGASTFNPEIPVEEHNYKTPSIVIANCYNLGVLNAKGGTSSAFSGLVGDSWGGPVGVNKSYNATGPIYQKNSFGISANNYEAVAGDVSMGAELRTTANMKGADVLENLSKMPKLGREWVAMGDGKYPTTWAFSGQVRPDMPDVWEGPASLTEPTAGGDGSSAEEAIIIKTSAELAYVIKNGGQGKYYKLANDIYLNETEKVDWTTGQAKTAAYPVAQWFGRGDVEPFYGTIDGDGHTIYGLFAYDYTGSYYENAAAGSALIPKATSGEDVTIKNLSIDCAYVHSSTNAAAFIGYTQGAGTTASFDRCYVGKDVTIVGKQAAAFVGASTFDPTVPEEQRKSPAVVISSCYNLGTLTKEGTGNSFSGFVGDSWGAPVGITKSYNATGPIYEKSTSGVCANNYETVKGHANAKAELRTPDMMKGLDVLENLSKMPKLGKQYVAVDGDYPAFTAVPAVDTTWDGFTRTEPVDSDGDGFIEIGTAEEFAYMVYSGGEGKKYLLTADIYLNDVTRPNWQNYDVNPWFIWSIEGADASRAFKGYVEGNGHTVYGLYRNDDVPQCTDQKQNWRGAGVGLFPILSTEATIRNIHVRESYISANAAVGAIAGKTYRFGVDDESKKEEQKKKKATIIGCSADESVTLHGWIVGGLVGGSSDCGVNLYYCYMTAKYSNTGLEGFANALIGDIWTASNEIIDSYYVGSNGAKGTYAYITSYGTGTNKKENGLKIVTKNAMTGSAAKRNMKNLDWTIWYTVDGKTPHLKVVPEGQIPPAAGEGRPGRRWYGLIASGFAGGTGTKNDPYLISTPEQLAFLVNNLSKYDYNTYYKITHDITLNDTSYKGWEEDALSWYNGWRSPFIGHLDGGGHVISGIYINDEKPNYSALFPLMTHDSSIKRLGIINSKIVAGEGDAAMCAPLIGFIDHWQPTVNPQYNMPVISECFADSTVYVEGNNVGGLVAGAPSPVKLENCYSTAELFCTSSKSRGALIGGAWGNDGGPTVINCYGTNTNRDRLVASTAGQAGYFVDGRSTAVNAYVDGPGAGKYIQSTIIEYMKGNNAKEYMPGLDYDKVWKIVEGGTPVLRCFKNAEKYSCKRELQKVDITFVTNGGNELEKMSGYPRLDKLSADDLPTPKKYGYKFGGWYYFSQCDLPFALDCYPDFDMNLYAKWEPVGFTVTFEGTPDPVYEYNAGVVQLKPGVKGYSPRYAHAGVKSMHTLPDSKYEPTFLLSYKDTLEVGKEYEVNFWVTTDVAKQSGEIRLVHAKYGDVHDTVVGDEVAFEYSNMIPGIWKKYTTTIVANSPYLLIKAPVGASLYFDDIQVVPTGEEGKLGELDNYKGAFSLAGLNLVTILIIAGGVLLLGAAAVVTVIVIKKKKA